MTRPSSQPSPGNRLAVEAEPDSGRAHYLVYDDSPNSVDYETPRRVHKRHPAEQKPLLGDFAAVGVRQYRP